MHTCTGCGKITEGRCGECGTPAPSSATEAQRSQQEQPHAISGTRQAAADGKDLLNKLTQIPSEDPDDLGDARDLGNEPLYKEET